MSESNRSMGTLREYIDWRGDLEFAQDGFNAIDNMILACVSYALTQFVNYIIEKTDI